MNEPACVPSAGSDRQLASRTARRSSPCDRNGKRRMTEALLPIRGSARDGTVRKHMLRSLETTIPAQSAPISTAAGGHRRNVAGWSLGVYREPFDVFPGNTLLEELLNEIKFLI